MRTWFPISLTVVALMAVTWGIFAQTTTSARSESQGFYVANSVLADGAKSPQAQSLTIFVGSRVYDISVSGAQVVVFDAEQGQVVLLDKQRKTKTEIGTADLAAARDELSTWCEKQVDPVLRFSGRPRFKIEKADHRLAFRADEIQYLVDTTSAQTKTAAAEYHKFSDAMVGLAVVAQSSPIPPLARLVVNRTLEKNGVLPVSVDVKMQARAAGERELHVRTHHAIGWQLRQQDRQLIDVINSQERKFRSVTVAEFFGRSDRSLSLR